MFDIHYNFAILLILNISFVTPIMTSTHLHDDSVNFCIAHWQNDVV